MNRSRTFAGRDFEHLGTIELELGADGEVRTYMPQLQASGARSLRAIARGLNERGIRTPRGTGEWKAGSVAQLLARLEA